MVQIQITRRKNADTLEQLIRKSDGLTLAYSAPNLTTILSGVTDPLFVLQKVGYPFTYQARNQTEFAQASFDTTFNLLLSSPDQPFGKL
jgi:hypothetical protein